MTNQEYIDHLDEGKVIINQIKADAIGNPNDVPPTSDQDLIRKLRDWFDKWDAEN